MKEILANHIFNKYKLSNIYFITNVGGESTKRKWLVAKTLATEGKLDDIDPEMLIKYYSTFKKIRVDYGKMPDPLPDQAEPRNFWYYGETGTGKSYSARAEYPGAYLKNATNKWWDGYQTSLKSVLIEDFDKAHNYMGFYLKIWADRYPFLAEVKGASMMIRPDNVIVTSNWAPNQIWTEDETLQPILRRFKVVKFERLSLDSRMNPVEEIRAAYVPHFVPPPLRIPSPTPSLFDGHDLSFLI